MPDTQHDNSKASPNNDMETSPFSLVDKLKVGAVLGMFTFGAGLLVAGHIEDNNADARALSRLGQMAAHDDGLILKKIEGISGDRAPLKETTVKYTAVLAIKGCPVPIIATGQFPKIPLDNLKDENRRPMPTNVGDYRLSVPNLPPSKSEFDDIHDLQAEFGPDVCKGINEARLTPASSQSGTGVPFPPPVRVPSIPLRFK